MRSKPHIRYEQLLEIVSWGIFSMGMKGNSVSDKRLKKCKKIDDAIYNGIYVGSPGRDIYYMLPHLNEDQMKEVAIKLSENFPKIPPKTYVNVAACIRFIYGQFEKQGILRSEKDFKRMKKEKLDWKKSREFLKLLESEFNKNNNYYGLSMLCEMEGHRLGDESLLNNNEKKIKEMEKMYLKSIKYAEKCNSYKHLFSIYYWCGEYFKKFKKTKKAVNYYKLSIQNASKYYRKYFPNGENYYLDRFKNSYKYILSNIELKELDSFKKKYKNKIKNKFNKKDV